MNIPAVQRLGVILLWVALFTAAVFAVCSGVTLLADWFATTALPAVTTWATVNPDKRDILTIGVLALLALAASQIRGRQ